MLHTIANNNFTAKISDLGVELRSFRDEIRGEEYIWQGDPEIWQGSAPVLFPIVGRLKDGQYLFNNKKYQLNKHGIARTSIFSLHHDKEIEKSFILVSNPEIELCYPFKFEFIVRFRIEAGLLQISYTVKNIGNEMMYFTLGSHPAFVLPLNECMLEDYYLEFEMEETLDRYFLKNGLLSVEPVPLYLNNEKIIPITKELFENDALIFKNIRSKEIYIKNTKTGHRLLLDTGNAPHLGIWAKPGAPYVCLEPWYSYDDSIDSNYDITNKSGIMKLDFGEEFIAGYKIKV